MPKQTSIEHQSHETPLLSKLKQLMQPGLRLGLAAIMTCILISCATSPEGKHTSYENRSEAQAQFDHLMNLILIIQSNYIKSIDMNELTKAAQTGMYRADASVKVRNSSFFSDPLIDLQEDYFYLIDNNPKLIPKDVIEHAIASIIILLHPHLALITLKTSSTPIASVGIVLQQMNHELVISTAIKESSAQRLGLERGDRLLKIEDQDVHDLPLEVVVPKLRGSPDTTVRLTVERDGKVTDVVATRAVVNFPPIVSRLYSKGIGYIRISEFVSSARELLDKQLSDLEFANGEALKGIILDLRDNDGGELRPIIEVADHFLDKGLIVSTRGRTRESGMLFLASTNDKDIAVGLKLVVLVNGQTSAGAEMLAAALQDNRRATVIGTTSQGLNAIYTVFPSSDGGLALKLMTGKMLRPSGGPFEIVPNICVSSGKTVSLDPEQYQSPEDMWNACPSETQIHKDDGNDVALQAAANVLLEKK